MIELKVQESMPTDVGLGIVRLDSKSRKFLGVSSGDIVEIEGKKKTAALVWQSYLDDEGQGIIRMDGIIRDNARVKTNDKVNVSKAIGVKSAKKVVFAPFRALRFQPDFFEYMKKSLINRPVAKGDTVIVTLFI